MNPNGHVSSQVIQQNLATAAQTAHTTAVAKLALKLAQVNGLTADQLLKESSVTPSATSSYLTISVTDRFRQRRELWRPRTLARTPVQQRRRCPEPESQIAQHPIRSPMPRVPPGRAAAGAPNAGARYELKSVVNSQSWTAAQVGLPNGNVVAQTAQAPPRFGRRPRGTWPWVSASGS